jgi:hypothetical protein
MYACHVANAYASGLPIVNDWKPVWLRIAASNTCHVARVDLVTRRDTDPGLVCELINLTMHAMQPGDADRASNHGSSQQQMRFICWVMDGSW